MSFSFQEKGFHLHNCMKPADENIAWPLQQTVAC
jgi:hypothetical protein